MRILYRWPFGVLTADLRDRVKENVLCLCPNDHVKFDHGAIYLTDRLTVVDGDKGAELGRRRVAKGHRIELKHVAYHRGLFGY
jgi:putative restriction endonuclease